MECERINPNVARSATILSPASNSILSSASSSASSSAAWRLEIAGHDRWAVYHRLQALAIDCHCGAGQPLAILIDSPHDLIQCWSVMRHATLQPGDRAGLAAQLETCWQLTSKP